MLWIRRFFFLCFFFAISVSAYGTEVRIKDIADVGISRVNYLIGYGLVVGLKNSGDSTSSEFTKQSVANMLEKM